MKKNENKIIYFFDIFLETRNRKNISIEIVCEKTKISKNIIESIESGNFNNISDTYIKLYLKSYAGFLELDSKKIINQYQDFKKNKNNLSNKKNTPLFIKSKEGIVNVNANESVYDNRYFIHKNKILAVTLISFITLFIIGSLFVILPSNIPDDWHKKKYQFSSNQQVYNSSEFEEIDLILRFKKNENRFSLNDNNGILNEKNQIFQMTINSNEDFQCLLYNNSAFLSINGQEISLPLNNKNIIKLEHRSNKLYISH